VIGFANIREFAGALEEGRTHVGHCRKVPSQASTAGWWVDLSMAGGNPLPNYYPSSPLVRATLNGDRGIWHGDDKSPSTMHLTEIALATPTAGLVGAYKLLDYVAYYPFVDGDSTDTQEMDNTLAMPRYADGDGVLAMLVATAPSTGGGVFTYDYVDDQGVSRTSPTITCSTGVANIASILTSEQATAAGGRAFLPLASGSKGIREITSLTYTVANGGNAALVLVKPLATHTILEINTPHEMQFVAGRPGTPRIVDGAYLGLIMNCAATVAAGLLVGRFGFAWSA